MTGHASMAFMSYEKFGLLLTTFKIKIIFN